MVDSQTVTLTGVLPVLPTPFDDDEQIMPGEIRHLVNWTIERGAHGVVVLGVAGEIYRLADDERETVITAAVEAAAGRIPVIAGSGHLSTQLARRAARVASAAGVSALLVSPPPVGKASPAAITSYYLDVASSVDVPIIVQDDPVHLGVGVDTGAIVQLATTQPNIRYVKLEELPSMAKIRAVRTATNDQVGCLGGSGGVYVLEELEAGAIGIMTGFALPEALVAVYGAWQTGESERARELFRQVSNLVRLEALPGVSLAIRKRLYQARGAMTSARLRSPAIDVDDWTWSLVARELAAVAPQWEQRHAIP